MRIQTLLLLFLCVAVSSFGQQTKPVNSVATMADLAARKPVIGEELQVRNQSETVLWSQPRTFRHYPDATDAHDGRYVSTNVAGSGRYVATDSRGLDNYGHVVRARTDLVNVAPATAYTSSAGSANWGATSGTSREFIQIGQDFRIRQEGSVAGARLSLPSTTGITSFKISVWRYNGSTYDLVGRSEDIDSQITAGAVSDIVLASPITGVKEGDFYGIQVLSAAFSTQNFYTLTSGFQATTPTIYYVDGSTPSSTNYAWASQTAATSRAFVCELKMRAPVAVFIGDSIAAGHGNNSLVDHYSFLEASTATHISNTWPYRVASALGWTYQNMGIGGNKLYDPANSGNSFAMGVSNRLTRDVINLAPRFAFFNVGRNDITGSTTQTQFTNAWRVIFDACLASNITPVVNYMFSGDDLSAVNLALIDTYNESLGTLISNAYPSTVIAAATKPWMNAYNPSYPSVLANLYALKPEVDSGDDVHPSPLGYGRLAEATLAAFSSARIPGALHVEGGITSGGAISSLQLNTGNLTIDDGASTLPAIKSRYEDSGVGRSSAGTWSTWIGGARELDITSTKLSPAADGGLSLGDAGANRFDKAYVKTAFVAPYGTNTAPSISFYQHEDSGLFYLDAATDSISMVGGGVRYWDFRMTDGSFVATTDGAPNIGRDGADRPGNIYLANSAKAPLVYATSNLLTAGKIVNTPTALQTLSASSQIIVSNTSVALVVGNGGAVTLTSTTTVPPGTDGQQVVIIGTSDSNTVTLQDEANLAGTWLVMDGQNRTLGRGDCLGLRYSSTIGKWVMQFFSGGGFISGDGGASTESGIAGLLVGSGDTNIVTNVVASAHIAPVRTNGTFALNISSTTGTGSFVQSDSPTVSGNWVFDELTVGTMTVSTNLLAAEVAYGAGWNNSSNVPTRNAVYDEMELRAPKASPALTGDPTAPTAALNDDDTSIATTAYVRREITNLASGGGGGTTITVNGSGTLTNIADGADITLATSGGTTATPTLTDTGVTNGTYTLSANGNTATVDAKGRITAIEDFDDVNDFDLVDEFVGPTGLLLCNSVNNGGSGANGTSAVTLTNLLGTRYMSTTGSNQFPSLYIVASLKNTGISYAQVSSRFYVPTLSDDANIFEFQLGAFDAASTTTNRPAAGSWITANTNLGTANFYLVNGTNATYNAVDTGIPLTASTWHNWTVRITPSNSVAFYGNTPVATNALSYPTTTFLSAWGFRNPRYNHTAAAARNIYFDNMKLRFRAGPNR